MINAYNEIKRMAECAKFPESIVDKSWDLYKRAQENNQLTFTSDAVASACLYIAARQEKMALSLKNMCQISKCSKKRIGKCFVKTLKVLNIQLEPVYLDPSLRSLCSDLDLPVVVSRMAHHIVQKAEAMKIAPQCDDQAIMAAAIFMASQVSNDKRTQKDVENISGVSGESIQEAYRLMYPHAATLIPATFELKAPIESLPQI
ncbi:transcription initiation factor IIB-like [Leguminivora glycinivorella]|uniref:transcription initiation factor IIB-like n=1 Tax=Leguminivora glycinivorella TaxID=1035111 RepID=UPI00200EFAC9|nr:transcription initiation factor IIB-like [Leguminivora glycinivorella]